MKRYFPGICWAIIIFILSSISIGKSILPDFWDLLSIDKAAHSLFYFFLFYLWAPVIIKDCKTLHYPLLILLLMCIIYGALLELYQGCFLPFRKGSWVDELANCIGASAAYFYNLIKIRKDPTNFRSVK